MNQNKQQQKYIIENKERGGGGGGGGGERILPKGGFIEIPRGDCWLMGVLADSHLFPDTDEAEADSGRISSGYR